MTAARKLRAVPASAEPALSSSYRMYVHRWYQRRVLRESNGMALLGFLSVLLRYSRLAKASDGGVSILVETTQTDLAKACAGREDAPGAPKAGELKKIKRYEKALEAIGIVLRPDRQSYRRVLEIVRPSEPGLRTAPKDRDTGVPFSECGELEEGDTGVPVDNSKKGTLVSPSRGHSCPQEGDTGVPLTTIREIQRESKGRGCARGASPVRGSAADDQAEHNPEGQIGHAAQAAADQVERVRLAIHEARGAGRRCDPLDGGGARSLERLLVDRFGAYREGPETSAARLATDVGRLLGFALAGGVNSPAAYLVGAVSRGDWRSDAAAGSEASRVTEELPVQDLGDRAGWDPETVDPPATKAEALGRVKRAQADLEGVRLPERVVRELSRRLRGLGGAGVDEQLAVAVYLETLVIEHGGGFGA